eukprot:1161373-Pelagomonas_calceolata.AAC.3
MSRTFTPTCGAARPTPSSLYNRQATYKKQVQPSGAAYNLADNLEPYGVQVACKMSACAVQSVNKTYEVNQQREYASKFMAPLDNFCAILLVAMRPPTYRCILPLHVLCSFLPESHSMSAHPTGHGCLPLSLGQELDALPQTCSQAMHELEVVENAMHGGSAAFSHALHKNIWHDASEECCHKLKRLGCQGRSPEHGLYQCLLTCPLIYMCYAGNKKGAATVMMQLSRNLVCGLGPWPTQCSPIHLVGARSL